MAGACQSLSHGQRGLWLDCVLDFSCHSGKLCGRGKSRTQLSTEC